MRESHAECVRVGMSVVGSFGRSEFLTLCLKRVGDMTSPYLVCF